MQIDQQIAGGRDPRSQIAEQELENHDLQVENAREVEEFMRDKYTNQELYGWMVGQISAIYFQSYQLAYDVAKRAERAFRYELGLKDSSFIQFGYWDSLQEGPAGRRAAAPRPQAHGGRLPRPEQARVRDHQARLLAPARSRWR